VRQSHEQRLFTIPAELKLRPQWMAYKLVPKVPPDPDGKMDKKPYDALNGQLADYTDCAHWCAYADALAAVQSGDFDGLAYVFSADDPYAGVDLDHSRDKASGEIAPWALDMGRRIDSYMEVSPSGTGVHIIVKAKLPPGGRKRGNVEMYDEKRFFTMTGMHIVGTPYTINERQGVVEAVHGQVFKTKPKASATAKPVPARGALSDEEVLQLATTARNGAKVAASTRAALRATRRRARLITRSLASGRSTLRTPIRSSG
jgi:putative DNA primase/helicase